MCSVKKVFVEIPRNSQGNTCASVFLNKVACNFIKKETDTGVFMYTRIGRLPIETNSAFGRAQ